MYFFKTSFRPFWGSRDPVGCCHMLPGKDLEAVIKSAVSRASMDSQGSPWATARHADSGACLVPLQIQGGCAGSRPDRGFEIPARESALAGDFSSLPDLST